MTGLRFNKVLLNLQTILPHANTEVIVTEKWERVWLTRVSSHRHGSQSQVKGSKCVSVHVKDKFVVQIL